MRNKKFKLLLFIFITFICFYATNTFAQDGWVEENGEKYFYENNQPVSGWKQINNEWYFFGITTYKLLHGWQYWNGQFYLDEEGKVKEGWNDIDGERYYVKDKYMVSQWQNIDGNNYFFGITTHKLLHGWQNWNGQFYLDEEGKVKEGWNDIDGERYYVKDKYMVSQWQNIDGNNYFFGITTHKLLHGWQNWNGLFYLDSQGKTNEGLQEIDNEKYFVEDRYMANGWKEIDGKRYFFGMSTYKLLHGWQGLNGQIWYQNNDGIAETGRQTISDRDYLFDENGILQGFREIDGKTYYYDPDSSEPVKGIQRIAGKYYKFNSITGAFENYVNQKVVIDVSFANNNIDWDKAWNTGKFDAVIMRLGFGSRSIDAQFYNNLAALKRLGIPYSVYLFSYAENYNEAVSEANFVINTMRKNGVYPSLDVYLDLEYWYNSSTGHTSNNISKESYEVIVKTFVSLLNQSGYKAGVYASKNYALERFNANTRPYVTWIAQYNSTCTYPEPYYGWQYTNDGWIDGIGRVDMSYFYY